MSRSRVRRRRAIAVEPVLVQQQAEAVGGAATDPAAQLVELREAEAFGMLDDHDGGLGHIHADLDHGRRHQQTDASRREIGERRLAHRRLLPAVRQADRFAETLAQHGEALLGGGEIDHLAFGDQRADPVDLRAASSARAMASDHLGHGRERVQRGADRLPAGAASR